jgi:hypothetical protein
MTSTEKLKSTAKFLRKLGWTELAKEIEEHIEEDFQDAQK